MNRVLTASALVLSLAALAVSLLGRDVPPPPPAAREVDEGPLRAELETYARRVEALEVTTLSLARRAAALERGMTGGPGAAPLAGEAPQGAEAVALAEQVQQLRAEVQGLIVGESMNSPEGRAQLKAAVQAAQQELVQERFQTRQQQAAQARKERLQRFIQEARLSGSQERELTRLLDTERQQLEALAAQRQADGSGGGRQTREAMRALRTETDAAAARVLDEAQRVAYEQMRRGERPDGRPRGGGAGRNADGAAITQ
jgi:hypothetical protein